MSLSPCGAPASFAIATMNPMKVRAVERVARRYCNVTGVYSVQPPPGLPSQPVGLRELVSGAVSRALRAAEEAVFGVGVEAGPMEFYSTTGFIEVQVAAVVGPGERVSLGLSPGFELPPQVVESLIDGVELAEAVEVPRRGDIGESIGYIGYLTWGGVTRQDLTEHAIAMALAPWANGYYGLLKSARSLLSRLTR